MSQKPMLIMAVDDEINVCALTKEFLEATGQIEVDIFGSVAEARAAVAGRHYDAIVSDYQMPVEDGIQFLKSLRVSGDTTPFILFTGKGREEVVIEAFDNGVDAYLQKGGELRSLFTELEHRIFDIVRRHRAETALLDSASEFRTLFENNPDPVVLVGIDSRILNCNQAAARMVLMSKEEIIGSTISAIGVFSPDDQALFQTAMISKAESGTGSPVVVPVNRKDGTVKWVEIRASNVMKEGRLHALQIIARDVTERKNAEEALKESERRLSDIINFLPDATFAIDTEGHVIAWNKAIEEMTGIPAYDMIGKGDHEYSIPFYGRRQPILIDLVSIPDEELSQHKYSKTKKEGAILLAETSIPRPQGRYATLMGKASLLYDHNGAVVGAIESIRDITESRHVEDALRAEQEKYIRTFLAVPDVVMISEIDTGMILEVNDAAPRVFGYSREELIGKSALDLGIWFHPGDRADLITLLKERGLVQDYQEHWRRKSGEVFSAEISADIITLERKDVLICVIHDITERVKADEALRGSEARLRTLVQTVPDMIWLKDMDGVYLSCNPMFERFFGAKEPDIVGKTDYDFVDKELADFFREHDRKAIEAGRPSSNEEWVTFKDDGHRAILETIKTPMYDDRGKLIGVLGIGRDITERKMAEDALVIANRKLNLLSSITRHDINNQTTVLKGYLALLKMEHPQLASNRNLSKAEGASGQISAIIEFTKTYEDIGVRAPIWQDLRTLIGSSAENIPLGEIVVDNAVPSSIQVFADPLIIKVFHNLIHNAVRHGGCTTSIRFYLKENDGVRSVVCEDNGMGIPTNMKEKLFTKGFGTDHGLGLFLTREILSITGITINEEGKTGQGAKFVITIPRTGSRRSDLNG
ncbi:MAG: PAS domain S-box protein [Methanomassiliicoccales archaeon]|jgi:PAS domain S-box-containing protein